MTGPAGEPQTLVATRRSEYPEGVAVYNFRVGECHTYYAAAPGGRPVLVHNADCGPISMEEALERAEQFLDQGIPTKIEEQTAGLQFIQNVIDPATGNRITKRVGFDVNPSSAHVEAMGHHLNLQTQINGKVIKNGPLADPHLPIDPSTVRSGDY